MLYFSRQYRKCAHLFANFSRRFQAKCFGSKGLLKITHFNLMSSIRSQFAIFLLSSNDASVRITVNKQMIDKFIRVQRWNLGFHFTRVWSRVDKGNIFLVSRRIKHLTLKISQDRSAQLISYAQFIIPPKTQAQNFKRAAHKLNSQH